MTQRLLQTRLNLFDPLLSTYSVASIEVVGSFCSFQL